MKTATITQAKNGLSALIDQVKAGERIVILDRGRPVARLEPIADEGDGDGRVARLVRAGLLRVGTGAPPVELMMEPGPALPPGVSAVAALLADREESW